MATAVIVVVAAVLLFRLQHDTSHLSDATEPTESQRNQQAENIAKEPLINREPVSPTYEPVADADTRTQPPDPRPKSYNSPPTGTRVEGDIGTSGHGELTVRNGTSEDAAVRLSDVGTDQTVRWFLVRAHNSAQVAQIPEGTYRLAFTTGLNWVESQETFSWHPSYSKFERDFTYSEERDSEAVKYHSISVTLHAVPFGNVKTRAISPGKSS